MLTLHDRDGHMDVSQVACRIIGFGLLHPADRLRKCLELIRRGRQFGIVLGVSAETPAEDRTGIDVLCAARVHVAAKEKDAGDPRGGVPGKDQSCTRAIAPR
jgi:hypothetical protein